MTILEAEGSPDHCCAKIRHDMKEAGLPPRLAAQLDALVERGVFALTTPNTPSIHLKVSVEPQKFFSLELT